MVRFHENQRHAGKRIARVFTNVASAIRTCVTTKHGGWAHVSGANAIRSAATNG
ncbi:MAG: hypothetical protein IID35_05625 [Planctomycetes bacterium]|nr:hypothetical protein [Planctomycetota bacterium]